MHVQPCALREQRLGDEQAVRADDDGRRVELEPLGRALGLEDGDPEPLGDDLRRRRRNLPSAPRGRVRPGQKRGDVVPLREPLEHVRPERRRRGDGDAGHADYARTSRGRSCLSASRRASGSVRSMISVPSR